MAEEKFPGNPFNTEQAEAILRKYATTYQADCSRYIAPEVLAKMTALEALVILEDESYALYSGSSGGGPVAEHAWDLLWELAKAAEK
jgi:hypothetical protein